MLRRQISVLSVGLCVVAATLLGPSPTAVADGEAPAGASQDRGAPLGPDDDLALARATSALKGSSARQVGARPDATIALRDLFLSRPSLDDEGEREAGRLLARPTDGSRDPYGDGYSVRSTRACSTHFCVHSVASTRDAPPSRAWVRKNLQVLEQVWRLEVGRLGYRAPARDGNRGGNAKFDVYLKELGSQGLFGYCAPERRVAGRPNNAAGFCVLDNDFARSQYGRDPLQSLRVTAAHEFFHAIQFAYDFREDPWLLESTATWMEERFADGVNDSRRYLRFGQVRLPSSSLDVFDPSGFNQYGNWTFWEFLGKRFGLGIVRQVWNRIGAHGGLPNEYSAQGLRNTLASRGRLPALFAAYAASNTIPGRSYSEGKKWPSASIAAKRSLKGSERFAWTGRVNHLAARNVRLFPARSVTAPKSTLTIRVDGPGRRAAPAAHLLVLRTNGRLERRAIPLNSNGVGTTRILFNDKTTTSATISVANASTRYRCRQGTSFSCRGNPVDQRVPFKVTARLGRG